MVLLLLGCGGTAPGPPVAMGEVEARVKQERRVRFHDGEPLGQLWAREWGSDNEREDWKLLGVARGEIAVPAGKELRLLLTGESGVDLSPLRNLGPLDLQALKIGSEDEIDDGDMKTIARLGGLTGLNLNEQARVTDKGLKRIEGLRCLKVLGLKGTKATDAGLGIVAGFSALEQLDLGFTGTTDAGLALIAGLRSMKELYLGFTRISDAGLRHLEGMRGMTALVLNDTGVTDAAMDSVAKLDALEWLYVKNTGVTDAGVAKIAGLRNLKSLDLGGTVVTDAAMESVSKIESLELLGIARTKVTDAGIERIAAMPKLQRINARGARIGAEKADALKAARAGLDVIR